MERPKATGRALFSRADSDEKAKRDAEIERFEQEVCAWGWDEEERDEEPSLTLIMQHYHEMLQCAIHDLRLNKMQSHAELEASIRDLVEIAPLDYPTQDQIPVLEERQAVFLKLITCFYQTICVISMETNRAPEEVYGDQELLLSALHRVHAMH